MPDPATLRVTTQQHFVGIPQALAPKIPDNADIPPACNGLKSA